MRRAPAGPRYQRRPAWPPLHGRAEARTASTDEARRRSTLYHPSGREPEEGSIEVAGQDGKPIPVAHSLWSFPPLQRRGQLNRELDRFSILEFRRRDAQSEEHTSELQ